eukprot:TRINITY_DN1212_c0_g2_i3.p2 TRINITY_DN1212_c0_g2~~TRINITY_DN1212_c0_g2_i3.p2  ORF type:complete len:127 (-),score=3.54 TRINITY_DN1212_c0_g2_i3:69-449(-)
MGETLTQQRRVGDEGFRVVKPCQAGRNRMVPTPSCADGTAEGSTGQLRASSRGNTGGASVIRNYWAQRARRRPLKSDVKARGLTPEVHLKLGGLSMGEGSGIPGVEVKFVDIRRNTGGEGDFLDQY